MKLYIPCCVCGKKAIWSYIPGIENYCESHVPRGCTCNQELKEGIDPDSEEATKPESYVERFDEKGRRLPCCEYTEISEECHNDKEIVDDAWDYYEELNPPKHYKENY